MNGGGAAAKGPSAARFAPRAAANSVLAAPSTPSRPPAYVPPKPVAPIASPARRGGGRMQQQQDQSPPSRTGDDTSNLNFFQRAAVAALDAFESSFITNLLEKPHALPRTPDPAIQIAGNFAPVTEQYPVPSLPVRGRIPPFINRGFARNGANPHFAPTAGYHLLDGDGMVHAVRVSNGRAESYACRFTETARLRQESAFGRPVFPKAIGELHGHSVITRLALFLARGLCGPVDPAYGTGVANAGLVYLDGRLVLAMSEDDLPYHVRVTPAGDLETVGRFDFDGQLGHYLDGRLVLAMSEDDLPYHVRVTPAGDLETVGRFDFDGHLGHYNNNINARPKVDPAYGTGVANAGLGYLDGRLVLAMSEDDLPYHVRVTPAGDLETVGRFDFDAHLGHASIIAHVDPASGDMFALSYDMIKRPYLKDIHFAAAGTKSADVEIELAQPIMIHDCAITENFVVVPDHKVVFNLDEMFRGGSPAVLDKEKTFRFVVLSKYAESSSEMVWVDVPDCFCFHLWNAWEEPDTDEVVVVGSCMTPADSIFNDSDDRLESVLTEIRLNTRTGRSTRRAILAPSSQVNLEVGMVNRNLLGRKTRYAYLAVAEPWPKVSGFAKVDLHTGELTRFEYGEGRFGGEPSFVPTEGAPSTRGEDDDGYILSFVRDEVNGSSEMLVVNAADMRVAEMFRDGSPVVLDKENTSRFGVLPKYAKSSSEKVWVDVSFCFQVWNAWEEPFESSVITNLLEKPHALPRTADNFAPVTEQPSVRSVPVSGRIPPFINGVYARNGASPHLGPEKCMENPREQDLKTSTSRRKREKAGASLGTRLIFWWLWTDTFELNFSELGKPIGPVTEYVSWEHLGRPMKQPDNATCAPVACTVAVEAMNRFVHGEGTGAAAEPLELLQVCKDTGIWSKSTGAYVRDVLEVILKRGGVPLANPSGARIVLPLRGFQEYTGDELTLVLLAKQLDYGPCVGTLWVCPWYYLFDASRNDAWVYRGCGRSQQNRERSKRLYREKVSSHAVVCLYYRRCGDQMHVLVLDNHNDHGPRRWVDAREIDGIYTLTVQ